MDNNEIKKYIVKITYNGFGGSGVIVPLSSTSEFFYIFTAKHTFFEKGTDTHNMNIANIEDSITVENPIVGNIFVKKEDIQSDINKEYDLLVFRILTNSNHWIKDLEPISIFSDSFRNCTVMGYPDVRGKKDTKYDAFACLYKQQNNKPYIFEMDSNKLLTTHRDRELNPKEIIAGISGSGVFVKGSTKELYLVGIQIQSATHNALIAIDLREIFDELNEKLNGTLTLGGYQFFEEIGLDIKKLEFDDLMDKLNNDNIQNIKKHDKFDSEIDFIKQPTYRDKMNSKYKQLQEKRKELSDTFLYQGIIFHKNGKNQQATNRFKKAITLYPDYKHYFAKAKFERDEIDKEQREAKEKIDKESAFNVQMAIETLRSDIEKYKADKNNKSLIEAYRQIIPLLSINYDDNESEIINFSKELAKALILNNEFIEAENILLNIEDDEVSSDLYKIYTNEEFSKNSCLNKKQFSNKLIDLLGRLDRQSIEYQDIKIKLEELNIFDNQMIEFHEKFVSLEEKYENTVTKLTQDIRLLSANISDKTLLNKINYRVFSTDKKLDSVSRNISSKIDTSTNTITKKLDEITTSILKTNNQKLNSYLENVYRSNQALVSKIQTMYHQNDRVNKKAKIALDNSIKSMNEKIENYLSKAIKSTNNMAEIKEIIESSNWNFYKGIQGLYEKESDSYNRKLLELSIAFTKREHELHIENLLEEKDNEIEKLALKYQNSKNKSIQIEKELTKLREKITNNTEILIGVDRLEYEEKIEDLKKDIEQLNERNKQIDELKESIALSSKTAETLDKSINNINKKSLVESSEETKKSLELLNNIQGIESNYKLNQEEYFRKIKKIYDEIQNKVSENKSDKILVKHLNRIEKEISEIKEKGHLDNDVLFRLDSQLQQIQDYLPKKKSVIEKLDYYFSIPRGIVVGGIILVGLIVLLLNKPILLGYV